MSSLFHQSKQLQRVSAAECEAFDARRPRMRSLFLQNKLQQRAMLPKAQHSMQGGRV